MDKSKHIKGGKEYMAKSVTPRQMETYAEQVLWAKMEEAFDRLKKNPELLATLKRMKDR